MKIYIVYGTEWCAGEMEGNVIFDAWTSREAARRRIQELEKEHPDDDLTEWSFNYLVKELKE